MTNSSRPYLGEGAISLVDLEVGGIDLYGVWVVLYAIYHSCYRDVFDFWFVVTFKKQSTLNGKIRQRLGFFTAL